MAKNPTLERLAEPLMARVRSDFEAGHTSARRYGEFSYRAGSWPQGRRVIVKAEVTTHFGRQPKDNPRFLITNLKTTPKHVYERVYCARGDAENRLKELKLGLQIDRTSCTRFLANQFRVLMTAAAYVPMRELRLKARWTSCARASKPAIQAMSTKNADRSARQQPDRLPITAFLMNILSYGTV